MPELSPYTFDLDDSTKEDGFTFLRKNVVGIEEITYKDERYRYAVIAKDLVPISRFVGMPGGHNLFASQEIPVDDRAHSLHHEIECNRLRAGEPGRCKSIEMELLDGTSSPEIWRHLTTTRQKTFHDLTDYYKIDLQHPPVEDGQPKEIAGTAKFLNDRMHMLAAENALAKELGTAPASLSAFILTLLLNSTNRAVDERKLKEAADRIPEEFRKEARAMIARGISTLKKV